MTVHYDNPAGRLHRILEALRDPQSRTLQIRDAWVKAVKADAKKHMQLERRVLLALQLPAKIQSAMDSIPDDQSFDREFAMRWHNHVQNAFQGSIFATGNMEQVVSRYHEGTLASLESCSYVLHRFRHEPLPQTSDLTKIKSQIEELRELLADSPDVDASLRSFLLVHINAMDQAIDDFDIAGSEALQGQWDQAVGALIRTNYLSQFMIESETEEDSPIKRFWQILTNIALILSITGSLLQLGQTAYKELEGRPGNSSVTQIVEVPAHPSLAETGINLT